MAIYKRGRVYYADVYISGARRRVPLDVDKTIAQQKYLQLLEQKNSRRFNRALKNAGWYDFKQEYFAAAAADKTPGTIKLEKAAINQLEAFRNITRLEQITPRLLDEFKAHLKTTKDVTTSTVGGASFHRGL